MTNLFNEFYEIAGTYGKNPEMREQKAKKWLHMYEQLTSQQQNMFWLLLDETNSPATSFAKLETA